MKRKKEIQEELRALSPFLSQLKEKEEPYEVPDGYFNKLPDEVLRQLNLEEKSSVPKVSWLDQFLQQLQWILQPRPILAMASIALLISVGIYLFRTDTNLNEQSFADLSDEEISTYVANNLDDFDIDLLIKMAPNDPNWEIDPMSDLEEGELDEYLEEMIDDIEMEDLEDLF